MKTFTYLLEKSRVSEVMLVLAFTVLMVLSAFIRIPLFFTPIPMTLQTFFLFVSIAALRRNAVFSQVMYLILGVFGLPVFANGGSGLLYLMGPTGGYLLGFVLAALIVPKFLPKKVSFISLIIAFSFVSVSYFALGTLWLGYSMKLPVTTAFSLGVLPFISADILKIVLAAFICSRNRSI